MPVDNQSFDMILLASVLGEVPDKDLCLKELYRSLRPKGLLSITEQPGDPDFIPMPEVQRLTEKEGFGFERLFGYGKNYTANFRKFGSK